MGPSLLLSLSQGCSPAWLSVEACVWWGEWRERWAEVSRLAEAWAWDPVWGWGQGSICLGGSVELIDIAGNVITVKMLGMCGGCVNARATLKGFIEKTLKEKLSPEIECHFLALGKWVHYLAIPSLNKPSVR